MHARFNLHAEDKNWKDYISVGNNIYSETQHVVETDLKKFEDADGIIQAEEIINNWFPNIKAEVFLSHSHKDKDTVVGLAGWLKKKFGLHSFIDSTVWGHSNRLLKIIDNKYCKNKSGDYYDYELRNRSTSHVHMMLSTALSEMIDRCECIIFVNTQNSFKPADYLKNTGKTESPWIYSEIAMTRLLRQKSPEEHRQGEFFESRSGALEHFDVTKNLHINYPVDALHLTPLTPDDLSKWGRARDLEPGAKPLDLLYEIMSKPIEF